MCRRSRKTAAVFALLLGLSIYGEKFAVGYKMVSIGNNFFGETRKHAKKEKIVEKMVENRKNVRNGSEMRKSEYLTRNFLV